MRKLALTFIVILISGCATTANYEKILDTWVGTPADSLVASWGVPQGSYHLSNGGKVIEYNNSRNVTIGGYSYSSPQTTYYSGTASAYGSNGNSAYGNYSGTSTTYTQKRTPTYNLNMSCTTRFTVDKHGFITKWGWQGNACKAHPPK